MQIDELDDDGEVETTHLLQNDGDEVLVPGGKNMRVATSGKIIEYVCVYPGQSASEEPKIDLSSMTVNEMGDNYTIYEDSEGDRYIEDDFGVKKIDLERIDRNNQNIRDRDEAAHKAEGQWRKEQREQAEKESVGSSYPDSMGALRGAESLRESEPIHRPYQTSQRSDHERTRYLSVEQSSEAVEGLIGSDQKLTHEVNSLAAGSIGVIKAIKEKIADEVSYDPAEALTADRIRSIVGAPSDPVLLEAWRKDFYEPYRQKYRAERRADS